MTPMDSYGIPWNYVVCILSSIIIESNEILRVHMECYASCVILYYHIECWNPVESFGDPWISMKSHDVPIPYHPARSYKDCRVLWIPTEPM